MVLKQISINKTNRFSKIIENYVANEANLLPFYSDFPTVEAIQKKISEKNNESINREVLVSVLQNQYLLFNNKTVNENIIKLSNDNCFTITTAHQCNLFSGPLYVVYKILHAIKLAAFCTKHFPHNQFVPVFYMGSEDADFDELNHIYLQNKKLSWHTNQTGAVGRMRVNNNLLSIIDEIESQLAVEPYGKEIVEILKSAYSSGKTVQDSFFQLLHSLFGKYGLIVLMPDNEKLKFLAKSIFGNEILHAENKKLVDETSTELQQKGYKTQAHAREINLFYLENQIRNRIEKTATGFNIEGTELHFSISQMQDLVANHPERFSPNVILRGLFQETILPNIIFIGGGGELAYWLQLKKVFTRHQVAYPLLMLRNSFMILEKRISEMLKKFNVDFEDLFTSQIEIVNKYVKENSKEILTIATQKMEIEKVYEQIAALTTKVDDTLTLHTQRLKSNAIDKLEALEKKMLKAEKRKFVEFQQAITKAKSALFPQGSLQERHENFLIYYAKNGSDFFDKILHASNTIEQNFTMIENL